MKTTLPLITLLGCCFLALPALGEKSPHWIEQQMWKELYDPPYKKATEIRKGNKLRSELFNVLRPFISKEAKQTVKFSGTLRVFKNWAFFSGETYSNQGKLMTYPPMDNSDTAALWLRTRHGWQVVDFSVGHSDVFWEAWHFQYGASREVLGFQ